MHDIPNRSQGAIYIYSNSAAAHVMHVLLLTCMCNYPTTCTISTYACIRRNTHAYVAKMIDYGRSDLQHVSPSFTRLDPCLLNDIVDYILMNIIV